jgi:hypothetical protein
MAEDYRRQDSFSDKDSEEFKLSTSPSYKSMIEVTEEEFVYFIGHNAEKYIPKFRKFNVDGVDKFAMTWHWPAFFFSYLWVAYRKMYAWSIVAFILVALISFRLPDLLLPLSIVFGMTGNYLYYKHAKEKIIKWKETLPPSEVIEMSMDKPTTLHKIGGVSPWAVVFWIFIGFVLMLQIGSIPYRP